MTKKTVGPGENGMRQGIHILTGLLLVVIVASALRNSLMQMGLVALVAATLGCVCAGARHRDAMSLGMSQLWLLALTLLWVVLLPIHSIAVYFGIPTVLFFICR